MKPSLLIATVFALLFAATLGVAHPGSGIVVDRKGNVYFIDTGSGIYKIDGSGKLTRLSGPAHHWLALDEHDRLAKATPPRFAAGGAVVTRVGSGPTLFPSSDFPVTVGANGRLYYPWRDSEDQPWKIFALSPSDSTSVFATLPPRTNGMTLRWVNGLATGPDGSVYYSQDGAVRRISPKGEVTTVVENPAITPCASIPEAGPDVRPYLRGLAVDSAGAVYVAATGCGAVLKIGADRSVTAIHRTTAPWSPTGVAVSDGNVYVLEYLHTPGDNRVEWIPRVVKIGKGGRTETIAAIERK